MKKEYIEALVLVGAIGLAIYLATSKDSILNSAKANSPTPTGPKGGFQNFTEDELTYDDHLYKNADGGLKGLTLK